MKNTALLILAAGSSSRLGRPKQLVSYKDTNLITSIVKEGMAAAIKKIIVVTGANAEAVTKTLEGFPAEIIYNDAWEEGMGRSIAVGVRKLKGSTENLIIAVCDQPFVSAALFNNLIALQKSSRKGIIASTYGDTMGTPALFAKKYFPALQQLTGDGGAKKILQMYTADLACVDFPGGEIDIDSEDDLVKLQ